MADVHRRLVWRHLRCGPTSYVRHLRGGRVAHEGVGLSFWYRALTAAISEVPVGDRELPLGFHARTADFQDVSVQGTLTYRITDPETAARRLDFDIDPDRGTWRSAPLEQLGVLLTETAQQYGIAEIARLGLRALAAGSLANLMSAALAGLMIG